MNFFGLLWVISAIGSFISPHEPPRALEYLSRTISNRSIALISRVTSSSTSSSSAPSPMRSHGRSVSRFSSPKRSFSSRPSPATSLANPTNFSSPKYSGSLTPVEAIYRSPRLLVPSLFSWNRSLVASLRQPAISLQAMLSDSERVSVAVPIAQSLVPQTLVLPRSLAFQTASVYSGAVLTAGLSSPSQVSSQISSGQNLSNPVLQVVSSFFRWSGDVRSAFKFATPLVTIVPAKNPCVASPATEHRWSYESRHGFRELNLGQCTELWRRDYALPEPVETVFQVRVKDQLVAELPTPEQAEELARRLQHVLRDADFDPYNLLPTVVNGLPAAKVENTVLFWIEPEWATLLDRNAELMAIAWVNNLRSALHVPTIPLIQAQSHMHGLIPTEQKIRGTASWYGPYFHGRLTATGEIFNQNDLTAAHPTLPFNTYLKVTNLLTGKTIIVRVNDRGPYFEDRSLDLSREAARSLGSEIRGVVPYEAVIMERADLAQVRLAQSLAQIGEANSEITPSLLDVQKLAKRP